jgi:hypothetical protein
MPAMLHRRDDLQRRMAALRGRVNCIYLDHPRLQRWADHALGELSALTAMLATQGPEPPQVLRLRVAQVLDSMKLRVMQQEQSLKDKSQQRLPLSREAESDPARRHSWSGPQDRRVVRTGGAK